MMDLPKFLLVYGSQTGQSKAIAEEIYEVATCKGYDVRLHCFGDTDKKFCLEKESCVVIVCSSTGDGECPDTVRKFWRRIKKTNLTRDYLSKMKFALLGLGDSNYGSFGRFPSDLKKQLLSLGAISFYPTVIADDGIGLEVMVDPWIEGLWPALDQLFNETKTANNVNSNETVEPLSNTEDTSNANVTNFHEITSVINEKYSTSHQDISTISEHMSPVIDSNIMSKTTVTISGSQDAETTTDKLILSDANADVEENKDSGILVTSERLSLVTNSNMTNKATTVSNSELKDSETTADKLVLSNANADIEEKNDSGSLVISERLSPVVDSNMMVATTVSNSELNDSVITTDKLIINDVNVAVEKISNEELISDKILVTNGDIEILSDKNHKNLLDKTREIKTNLVELKSKNGVFKNGFISDVTGKNLPETDIVDDVNVKNLKLTPNGMVNESVADKISKTTLILQETTAKTNLENVIKRPNDNSVDFFSTTLNTECVDENAANNISVQNSSNSRIVDTLCMDITKLSLDYDLLRLKGEPVIGLSASPLTGTEITVPKVLSPYLNISFDEDDTMDISCLPYQNGANFPFAASPVYEATIISSKLLTRPDAIKQTVEVEFDITGSPFTYEAGDALSMVCQNDQEEVRMLLERLDLSSVANCRYTLSVLPDTKKKNPAIPIHIPPSASLAFLFATCVDIREPPKKATLRMLADYTSDSLERQWLLDLCSVQGAEAYSKYIRTPNLSLLDVLYACKSSHPPIQRLIERLPRLTPRPYSASSCPNYTPNRLKFTFNIVDVPQGEGRLYHRHGVCTGCLFRAAKKLGLPYCPKVPLFARTQTLFHLPSDPLVPLLLIGPGTGVAPFIGFLHHRQWICENEKSLLGEAWLFFGCRHKDRDFIYREELEAFQHTGVLTNLCVAFSRDNQSTDSPCYVQDNLRHYGKDVVRLIESNGRVYVCGEAKNMARQVWDTIIDVFMKEKNLSLEECQAMMQTLRHERRYLEDIW